MSCRSLTLAYTGQKWPVICGFMPENEDPVVARLRAAQALGGFRSADALADELKERGAKNLGIKRLRKMLQGKPPAPERSELREIAAACRLPVEFFDINFFEAAGRLYPERYVVDRMPNKGITFVVNRDTGAVDLLQDPDRKFRPEVVDDGGVYLDKEATERLEHLRAEAANAPKPSVAARAREAAQRLDGTQPTSQETPGAADDAGAES